LLMLGFFYYMREWLKMGFEVGRPQRLNLRTRYEEHLRNIKNNIDESVSVQHILNTGHQYGPMEQIMEIVEWANMVGWWM
jgi:hypothetical protein